MLDGGGGDDVLEGGLGADRLDGGPGHDALGGGDGDDILQPTFGAGNADAVTCGGGRDLVTKPGGAELVPADCEGALVGGMSLGPPVPGDERIAPVAWQKPPCGARIRLRLDGRVVAARLGRVRARVALRLTAAGRRIPHGRMVRVRVGVVAASCRRGRLRVAPNGSSFVAEVRWP